MEDRSDYSRGAVQAPGVITKKTRRPGNGKDALVRRVNGATWWQTQRGTKSRYGGPGRM